jgi:AcrR family transcriptional regulator
MQRRLEGVEETRRRITAAAFELHASVGPSQTSVKAIAERAGVQRHTVYAHFPDLDSLYLACTEHGMRSTGMPEPGPWRAVAHPGRRMRHALGEVYAWYRANERMLANVLHDVVPESSASPTPDPFGLRMHEMAEALTGPWAASPQTRPLLRVVVVHALAFDTWRSLVRAGLADSDAAGLLVALAEAVAGGSLRPEPNASLGRMRSSV